MSLNTATLLKVHDELFAHAPRWAEWPFNSDLLDAVAYQQYAAAYNYLHPDRRVSWRRLNRHQRAQAERLYLP